LPKNDEAVKQEATADTKSSSAAQEIPEKSLIEEISEKTGITPDQEGYSIVHDALKVFLGKDFRGRFSTESS
jgi:hypothetical protein